MQSRDEIAYPRPDNENEAQYQPQTAYRKFFFKECPIAGLSFHLEKDDDLWLELEEGMELALVRERFNEHDPNAVAVALADDYGGDPENFDFELILGYIPRTDNAEIAAMMDAGFSDKIKAELSTLDQYGPFNDRIRITIYIESRKPVELRPDLLRAEWLTDEEYDLMLSELREDGFALFNWGCYGPSKEYLPESGDKVVLLHRDEESVKLYLMHVLMTGDDCLNLGINKDEALTPTDCLLLALTNVSGPIEASGDELPFLYAPISNKYSIHDYLPPHESDALKQLFGITSAVKNQL